MENRIDSRRLPSSIEELEDLYCRCSEGLYREERICGRDWEERELEAERIRDELDIPYADDLFSVLSAISQKLEGIKYELS